MTDPVQMTTDALSAPDEAAAMTFRLPDDKPHARRKGKDATAPRQATLLGALVALSEKGQERAASRTEELRDLLGSAAPKEYELVWLPFSDIDIEGIEEEALIEDAQGMLPGMSVLGSFSEPVVEMLPTGRHRVVAGRRRLLTEMLAAQETGKGEGTWVKRPIGGFTSYESALVTFAENHSRRDAWVRDVRNIALMRARGMEPNQIERAFSLVSGRTVNEVRSLVRMALLPQAFVDLIVAGRMTKATASKLVSLPDHLRAPLLARAEAGDAITVEDIRAVREVGATATFASALAAVEDTPEGERPPFDRRVFADQISRLMSDVRRSGIQGASAISTMLSAILAELSRKK